MYHHIDGYVAHGLSGKLRMSHGGHLEVSTGHEVSTGPDLMGPTDASPEVYAEVETGDGPYEATEAYGEEGFGEASDSHAESGGVWDW